MRKIISLTTIITFFMLVGCSKRNNECKKNNTGILKVEITGSKSYYIHVDGKDFWEVSSNRSNYFHLSKGEHLIEFIDEINQNIVVSTYDNVLINKCKVTELTIN